VLPLPRLVGDNVLDLHGRSLGKLWYLTDDHGNRSIACRCNHAPPCKKRTTLAKHPSEAGALRWLAACGSMTKQQHLDAYEALVIPEEFRKK
jgi:hypothetical protein